MSNVGRSCIFGQIRHVSFVRVEELEKRAIQIPLLHPAIRSGEAKSNLSKFDTFWTKSSITLYTTIQYIIWIKLSSLYFKTKRMFLHCPLFSCSLQSLTLALSPSNSPSVSLLSLSHSFLPQNLGLEFSFKKIFDPRVKNVMLNFCYCAMILGFQGLGSIDNGSVLGAVLCYGRVVTLFWTRTQRVLSIYFVRYLPNMYLKAVQCMGSIAGMGVVCYES